VFLDLPSPQLAIPHAYELLKHGGYMCNFSPCIEQVQRACLKMEELKFQNIFTIECLSRKYESNHRGYMELIAKEDDK